jgi:hypothetical protein
MYNTSNPAIKFVTKNDPDLNNRKRVIYGIFKNGIKTKEMFIGWIELVAKTVVDFEES